VAELRSINPKDEALMLSMERVLRVEKCLIRAGMKYSFILKNPEVEKSEDVLAQLKVDVSKLIDGFAEVASIQWKCVGATPSILISSPDNPINNLICLAQIRYGFPVVDLTP